MPRGKFHRLASFLEWSQEGHSFDQAVLVGLDLTGHAEVFADRPVAGLLLLGCRADAELVADLTRRGALHFPTLPGLPFQVFRTDLYTVDELFDPPSLVDRCRRGETDAYAQTLDGQIYAHFCQTGRSRPHDIFESLAQRLHDHSITEGIESLIRGRDVVGIMGGHSLQRTDPAYHGVAFLARTLAQEGFLLVSGGGPGAMEACHLGVYFVDQSTKDLEAALSMLERAPDYRTMNEWLLTGLEVKERYPLPDPQRATSLGVPTWYFGHEPPNVFASHVGKYFSNSVREDGLVTIARHGLVFAKGSAGTIQEIFQDQTQNYYQTEGEPSPMILVGEDYWKWRRPIYPLLCSMAVGRAHDNHLHITDSNDTIVSILKRYRDLRQALPQSP
jgi:predicted Rossmann-fold nucleotide-binding protein